MNTIFLRKATIVLVAVFFASCDKDYNTLGSDIVGNDDFTTTPDLFDVKAYNQKIPAVQTNNLSVNQLGVMFNDVFGKTKSNYVTQLSLTTVKPTFKNKYSIKIDSVILTVPYYSTKTNTDADGKGTYTLNSIYTTNTTTTTPKTYDPINLKVFRSNYYLGDSDLITQTIQKHFSNEDATFDANRDPDLLNNDTNVKENTSFVPSAKEYVKYKVANNIVVMPKEVESRSSPRMRLHLDTIYFKNKIIKAPSTNLDNNNTFKSYFRGLYFQVNESVANIGTSMVLDFAKGDVTIYYKQDKVDVPGSTSPASIGVGEMASLTLSMTGNTVNLFNNTDNPVYSTAANNPSVTTGDKNLYLKGGQGSMAFLELFSSTQLADLKAKNVLVNEASLTFTVNKTGMTSEYRKPSRIYIYDADNNTPLYDYYLDASTNASDASLNKFVHGGILVESTTKDTYKIRITEYINNILKEATGVTKNVRLGLVVTGNINITNFGSLNPTEITAASSTNASKKMDKSSVSSTISTLGTVLYGTNYLSGDADYDKRIKFEIYYTKPN